MAHFCQAVVVIFGERRSKKRAWVGDRSILSSENAKKVSQGRVITGTEKKLALEAL
jgi:hypothetical protein